MLPSQCFDLLVIADNRIANRAHDPHQGQHRGRTRTGYRRIVGRGHGAANFFQTPIDAFGLTTVVLNEEFSQGFRPRLLQGYYKLDFDGNLIWKADLGKIDTLGYGYGPSPVLYKDKVIVLADQDDTDKSFIAALSNADGKAVWKTSRKITNTWGTPVIVNVGGDKQVVVNGSASVIAYDPKDGKQLWRSEGPSAVIVHTPVFGAGMVFASVGFPEKKTLAIRLTPAQGKNRLAWGYTKGTSYVPSPLFYDGYLYLMSDWGMLTCLDAKTGEVKYAAKRVPDPGTFTSSLTAFDGKILMTSDDDDTYVIKAGPEFDVMQKNSVGETVMASPALAGDSIYIRSDKSLFRIRNNGQ
jgi:outer membrane protein assembly factor BamB